MAERPSTRPGGRVFPHGYASLSFDSARAHGREAAADHLQQAWQAVYGLHPEPSKAFGELIRAVEAVAIPVVVPNQASATLGHVLGQLQRQGHLYELGILGKDGKHRPVEPVVQLVGLLWEGHTDRHEGNEAAVPISPESAEIALHAAATLVQWFSTGAVRRHA